MHPAIFTHLALMGPFHRCWSVRQASHSRLQGRHTWPEHAKARTTDRSVVSGNRNMLPKREAGLRVMESDRTWMRVDGMGTSRRLNIRGVCVCWGCPCHLSGMPFIIACTVESVE